MFLFMRCMGYDKILRSDKLRRKARRAEPLNLEVRDMSDFKNTNDIDFTGDLEAYRPEEIPALTLDPVSEELPAAEPAKKTAEPVVEMRFTPEEQKAIEEFKKKIDITNTNQILRYGVDAQQKIASFSEMALGKVRTKDLGEVGDMIGDLVIELKSFDADEEPKGFLGFFKKSKNKIEMLKTRYDKAEVNVDKIAQMLEDHQIILTKDVAMLDQMYQMNLGHFRQLSMYIAAGKQKLEEARSGELPALVSRAQVSGLPEDTQKAKDYAEACNRFEKKIYDLELTRTVSMQMAPQIRLVQNNNTTMAERIQTALVNTIPLWKSQMVLALGLAHSEQAMQAQRAVSDATNELLRKNAEKLKMSTIETAKESERGIIDIETLQATNRSLIETLDEVRKIQAEGADKRRAAEAELVKIEDELKKKLLEIRGQE